MVAYVAAHRARFGVESICARAADRPIDVSPPSRGSSIRRRRSARPTRRRAAVARSNGSTTRTTRCTAPRKVWKQLPREGVRAARCTVGRLMRALGLAGAVRGRAWVVTTHGATGARPADLVDRQFVATHPNQLWVSDFTYVATWGGFVYVAFVIDVFARRVVGWRVSTSLRTDFVLDALEQAIYARGATPSPAWCITATAASSISRCATPPAWTMPASRRPWGARGCLRQRPRRVGDWALQDGGDSRKGPWRSLEAVEFATLGVGGLVQHRRLLGPMGTCRRRSSKRRTMPRPRWPDSTNPVSEDPGTLQATSDARMVCI